MATLKTEDVVGRYVGEELYHLKCVENGEKLEDATLDELLTTDDMNEEEMYFCDHCKMQIE